MSIFDGLKGGEREKELETMRSYEIYDIALERIKR